MLMNSKGVKVVCTSLCVREMWLSTLEHRSDPILTSIYTRITAPPSRMRVTTNSEAGAPDVEDSGVPLSFQESPQKFWR